jgi:hypothetical protein
MYSTVFLVIISHEFKHIIINITVVINIRFNTPVIIILIQKWMSKEEAALESKHVFSV